MRPAGKQPLSSRDREVVQLVGRFQQLTSGQIGELLFTGLASSTPRDRCLRRLLEDRYLSRLDVRLIGGDAGGSSQHVYQLGPAGWRLLGRPGRYWARRAANRHAIELADVYVRLKTLENSGNIQVVRFDVEREAWRNVAGIGLTPDAYVEIGHHISRTKVCWFIELDRETESVGTIRERCARYVRAYERWDEGVFPYVLFLVPTEARATAVRTVIASGPAEADRTIRACSSTDAMYALAPPSPA